MPKLKSHAQQAARRLRRATQVMPLLRQQTKGVKMKQLILSHKTALDVIRQIRLGNKDYIPKPKVDILVDNPNFISKSKTKRYHLNSQKLPKGSLLNINNEIKTCSACYLLVQFANILNFEHLSLLILEFCGTYSINSETNTTCTNLYPLTSIQEIKNYVKRFKSMNPNAKGINKILKICDFANNNSASPMESRVFIKLCGPKNKGFYGCKNLKLNHKVNISDKAKLIAGQNYITPDISCKNKKVAIEYDSAQFHENTPQGQRDKRRRDALVYDG